jgi:Asp-tRNA(Asn)/Glu-tRNA(Gln) amidotransferase A subunit family amidase
MQRVSNHLTTDGRTRVDYFNSRNHSREDRVVLEFLSVEELTQGFAEGALSPVEATKSALRAIETHDAALNAFRLVDADAARKSARASERRWRTGEPLSAIDGVPSSVMELLLA